MVGSEIEDASKASRIRKRVGQILDAHIRDLQSPSSEELQRLVYELEVHRLDLEMQNKELLQVRHQLQHYRDRYVDLYDFAPLGYVTLDEDSYVQEINLTGAAMLEADRATVTGHPLTSYLADPDRAAFLEHLKKCVREDGEVISEAKLQTKSGREVAVQLRSVPVGGPDSECTLCKTAITDITKRKQAEDSLNGALAFVQTLVEASPDGIVVMDRDRRILLANRAIRKVTATKDPASNRLACHQLFHGRDVPCDKAGDRCPLAEVLATRAPVVVTHTHRGPDGKQIINEVRAAPIFDQAGEVMQIVKICSDITSRKRAEEQLQKTQEDLEKRVEARTAELAAANLSLKRQIAERREAVEALRESEERFSLAVRGTDAGIWDWELPTNKVYFSARWKSMLGYEEDEISDRYSEWESRLHADDRQRALTTISDYLEGKSSLKSAGVP